MEFDIDKQRLLQYEGGDDDKAEEGKKEEEKTPSEYAR